MAAVSFVSPAPSERVDPEDSVHNADKRGKATAESFNGLMTISRQQTTRLEREQKRATLQTKSNLKSASRGAQEQAAVATRDWRFWVAIIAALSLLPVLLRG